METNKTTFVNDENVIQESMDHIMGIVRSFDRKKAEETREIDFTISTEQRDRHGTIIPVKNWKLDNYNKNGIVGYMHEVYGDGFFQAADPDDVIGSGKAFVEDGELIGRIKFEPAAINPKAEKLFQKVLHGTIKATSVGFIENTKGSWGEKEEARDGENPTYYFGEVELLEFSLVNIPSNPGALRRKNEHSRREPLNERMEEQIRIIKNENSLLVEENNNLRAKVASLKTTIKVLKLKRPQRG